MAQRMNYPSASGGVEAYLVEPSIGSKPWPALIVVPEVFGLVDHIEDVARRFAAEGYLALAVELYCHDPVRKAFSDHDILQAIPARFAQDPEQVIAQLPADRQPGIRKTLDWLINRDTSTYLPDLQDAVNYLKSRPDVKKNAIGAVGFCMGGMLSGALAASGAGIAAAVVYYGQIPPLDQVPNIRCPVLGHYAGEDPPITPNVPKLKEAMQRHKKEFTAHIYEGAKHAFNNDQRANYHPGAAKLAWGRTLEFFQKHLKDAK